jgi:hypothetical protein
MDDPSGFLTMRGWKTALTQAGAPDANHGRWHLPVIPVAMPDMPHNWFVTAKKGIINDKSELKGLPLDFF